MKLAVPFGEEDTRRALTAFRPEVVAAFVATLGGKAGKSSAETAREAARLLHETDRLERWVESLPADQRDVFLICVVHGAAQDRPAIERRAWQMRAIPRVRVQTALNALERAGALDELYANSNVEVIPGALAGCAPAAVTWVAGARPDQSDPLPVRFLLALLASVIAGDPAPLTQARTPHARWMSKASERMLHPACAPWWTERLVVVGARLGLWPADTAADGTRLRLSAAGARAAFALPTDAFTRAFVGRGLGGDEPTCYGLTLGARVFRRAGAGEAPFQAVMDEARALREIPTHVTHGFVPWRSDDVLQVADALHAATLAGALTLDHGPFLDRIRRAPEPPSDGRWTVLPNYRVLVPSDTPPQDVFRLACIARLERVDRVAEFLLDRASVSRRSSIEGLDGSAVEILTSRSTHALPETVVQALAEWDRGAPPLRTFIGAVVLTSTPEQAEFLRADASTPAEIAPGVFHVAEYEVRAMLDRARKRGLPIGRVAQASPRGWQHTSDVHETLPDLAAAVRDFSRRFDVVVASEPPKPAPKPAQAAKPGPKATTAQTSKAASAASSATGAASAATLAETIIRTVAIGPRVLRRDFGRFRTALSDDPDLLRRAERLTEDHFDEVEDLQGREAIRSWVREESERWEAAIARIAATAEGAGPADVEDAVARALDVASGGAGSNIDDDEDDDDWLDDEDEDDEAEDDFPSTSEILARLLGTKHAPKGKTSPSPRSSPTSRAGAAAAPSRTPSAAPPPKPPERPWSVHPAGELRRHLADAAEREALVELLYVNAEGRKHERTVRPKSLLTKDGHDWLAVVEPSLGNAQVNLRLDRIAAIRG